MEKYLAINNRLIKRGGKFLTKNFELRSRFAGRLTPMNGAYNDWIYNSMTPVNGKIYYVFSGPASHYNADGYDNPGSFGCYNPKTGTVEFIKSVIDVDDNNRYPNSLWYKDGVLYGIDKNTHVRVSTSDFGDTWTSDALTGSMVNRTLNYPCVLRSGRIIASNETTAYNELYYSDDNGINWETINKPWGDNSHSHANFYELDDCVVAYFRDKFSNDGNLETMPVRMLSVSYDDGLTWSTPVQATGEFASCGQSFNTGSVEYLDGMYHFFSYERIHPTAENGMVCGQIRWFTGTANNLKNGTMSYKGTVHRVVVNGTGVSSVLISDTGNAGSCLLDDTIYIGYCCLVCDPWPQSTSMVRLFEIGYSHAQDAPKDWVVDENWESTGLTALASKDTSNWDYYVYSNTVQNIFGSGVNLSAGTLGDFTHVNTDAKTVSVSLGTGDYRVELLVDNMPFHSALAYGIKHVDGTFDGLGGGSNSLVFNRTKDIWDMGALPGLGRNNYAPAPCYMIIERKNGHMYATVKGFQIHDWIYHYTHSTLPEIPEVTEDTFYLRDDSNINYISMLRVKIGS